MIEKTASVHWEGQGKKGVGKISTQTGALKGYPYGFGSRFEDDRTGTNPEEILGAAHAACFATTVVPGIDETQFAMIAQPPQDELPALQGACGGACDHARGEAAAGLGPLPGRWSALVVVGGTAPWSRDRPDIPAARRARSGGKQG